MGVRRVGKKMERIGRKKLRTEGRARRKKFSNIVDGGGKLHNV